MSLRSVAGSGDRSTRACRLPSAKRVKEEAEDERNVVFSRRFFVSLDVQRTSLPRGWRRLTLTLVSLLCTASLAREARAEWPPLPRVLELSKERSLSARDANAQVAIAGSYQTWARLPWLTNPYFEFQATKGPSTKDLAFYSFLMLPVEINGQRGARIDEADAMLRWRTDVRDDVKARTAGDAITVWGIATAA